MDRKRSQTPIFLWAAFRLLTSLFVCLTLGLIAMCYVSARLFIIQSCWGITQLFIDAFYSVYSTALSYTAPQLARGLYGLIPIERLTVQARNSNWPLALSYRPGTQHSRTSA